MIVDRKWFIRNLGYDPVTPQARSAIGGPKKAPSDEDLQREIIDFDSEAEEGRKLFAFSKATGLSAYTDVPWPSGLAPQTGPAPGGASNKALPQADVLVVTWTVDEGHALSRVLTPGRIRATTTSLHAQVRHDFEKDAQRLSRASGATPGAYWTTKIGSKSVVVFKSGSHMSRDGPVAEHRCLAADHHRETETRDHHRNRRRHRQDFEVGDVVVSPIVRFDCTAKFKNQPFHDAHYVSNAANSKHFAKAKALFKANAAQLPGDNTRQPKIFKIPLGGLAQSVVTTDFFGFDTSDNHYHLQGLGDVSEMGDAILGLVASQMNGTAPRWLAVRNVSDPQIKAVGTLREQAQLAAQIYKGYGRWSSVCSAIICWALIAAE
jgi:hypothetical protein